MCPFNLCPMFILNNTFQNGMKDYMGVGRVCLFYKLNLICKDFVESGVLLLSLVFRQNPTVLQIYTIYLDKGW